MSRSDSQNRAERVVVRCALPPLLRVEVGALHLNDDRDFIREGRDGARDPHAVSPDAEWEWDIADLIEYGRQRSRGGTAE